MSQNGKKVPKIPLHDKSREMKLEELGYFLQEAGTELRQLKDMLPVSKAGINRCFFPFVFTTVRERKKPMFTENLLCAETLPNACSLNRRCLYLSKRGSCSNGGRGDPGCVLECNFIFPEEDTKQVRFQRLTASEQSQLGSTGYPADAAKYL